MYLNWGRRKERQALQGNTLRTFASTTQNITNGPLNQHKTFHPRVKWRCFHKPEWTVTLEAQEVGRQAGPFRLVIAPITQQDLFEVDPRGENMCLPGAGQGTETGTKDNRCKPKRNCKINQVKSLKGFFFVKSQKPGSPIFQFFQSVQIAWQHWGVA